MSFQYWGDVTLQNTNELLTIYSTITANTVSWSTFRIIASTCSAFAMLRPVWTCLQVQASTGRSSFLTGRLLILSERSVVRLIAAEFMG